MSAISPTDKSLPSAEVNRFKGNLIRVTMLVSRDLLQKGMPLQKDQNFDHCLAVACQTGQLNGFVNELKAFASKPTERAAFAAQGFDLELYEADTRRLIAEVVALMEKAPRR